MTTATNFFVQREMPYSEVCMHMKIAGKQMFVEPVGHRMAQLYDLDGRKFSAPISWGEAGITDYHAKLLGWLEWDSAEQRIRAGRGDAHDHELREQHEEENRCPHCGATAHDARDEVAHMEAAHPEIIKARLRAAGMSDPHEQ